MRTRVVNHWILGGLLSLVLMASACSPEATRVRGGGPGADIGNRTYPLPEIHGGSNSNLDTPRVGQGIRR